MTRRGGNVKEISLGDKFGDVTVKVNGVRVEVHTDQSADIYTNGPVQVHPPANDGDEIHLRGFRVEPEPQIGDKMPDGTVFAGISPNTRKPIYATPADAPRTYTFNEAQKYAATLHTGRHHDWRVPTKAELSVLWENQDKGALKGTFNVSGSESAGWYWSSSQGNYGLAWAQRLSDGGQNYGYKTNDSSLRCVR